MTDNVDDKGELESELDGALNKGKFPAIARFVLQCLGGGIPVAGGVFGAGAGAWSEAEQNKFNKIFASWLKLQEDELREIAQTLAEVLSRLDPQDPEIEKRLQSPQYLSLVKKCFRDWSAAESEDKRALIRNLLVNAAGIKLCEDDLIKLFIEWIARYSEAHFKVIRTIYRQSGITRQQIWDNIHGRNVREDSSEADLFRLLVDELSQGRIIRQHREKDYHGNFLKAKPAKRSTTPSRTMTSAFDDEKEYELTELGKKFVHYTMTETVTKISGPDKAVNG